MSVMDDLSGREDKIDGQNIGSEGAVAPDCPRNRTYGSRIRLFTLILSIY